MFYNIKRPNSCPPRDGRSLIYPFHPRHHDLRPPFSCNSTVRHRNWFRNLRKLNSSRTSVEFADKSANAQHLYNATEAVSKPHCPVDTWPLRYLGLSVCPVISRSCHVLVLHPPSTSHCNRNVDYPFLCKSLSVPHPRARR